MSFFWPFFSGRQFCSSTFQQYDFRDFFTFSFIPDFFHSDLHRGREGPFNTFSNTFSNKVFYVMKLVKKFKFYAWIIISGIKKGIKKGQEEPNTMFKKNLEVWLITYFPNKFALANCKYNFLYLKLPFTAQNVLGPLPTLNTHLVISKALL